MMALGPNAAIAVALGLGLLATAPPTDSPRPHFVPVPVPVASNSLQAIPARHWEDPLGAAFAATDVAVKPFDHVALACANMWEGTNWLCILSTMNGSSWPEEVERRMRDRYAMLSALEGSGYLSTDTECIGRAALDISGTSKVEMAFETLSAFSTTMEWPVKIYAGVLVLYVSEDSMTSDRFGSALVAMHSNAVRFCRDCVIVGPSSSDSLRWLLKVPGPTSATPIRVLSPRATLGDRTLRKLVLDAAGSGAREVSNIIAQLTNLPIQIKSAINTHTCIDTTDIVFQRAKWKPEHFVAHATNRALAVEMAEMAEECDPLQAVADRRYFGNSNPVLLQLPGSRFRIERVCGEDSRAIEGLVRELKLRRTGLGSTNDLAALFAESDTLYGRSLPIEFVQAVFPYLGDATNRFDQAENRGIHVFSYFRGLDGITASRAARPAAGATNNGAATVGLAQDDYVARFVQRMKAIERKDRKKFRAIGVLGTDVYDKLFLLRKLKPAFPAATFFTLDLDAVFLSPREYPAARNLIVAAPYGLELEESLQGRAPPFRDSYQAAVYFATLRAVRKRRPGSLREKDKPGFGRVGDPFLPLVDWKPWVFEVGRNHLERFKMDVPTHLTFKEQAAFWSPEDRGTDVHWRVLGLVSQPTNGTVTLFRLGSPLPPWEKKPVEPLLGAASSLWLLMGWFAWARRAGRTFAAWTLAWAALVFVIQWLQSSPEQEPFGLFSGCSVWPATLIQGCLIFIGVVFLLPRRPEKRFEVLVRRPARKAAGRSAAATGAFVCVIGLSALYSCWDAHRDPVRGGWSQLIYSAVIACAAAAVVANLLLGIARVFATVEWLRACQHGAGKLLKRLGKDISRPFGWRFLLERTRRIESVTSWALDPVLAGMGLALMLILSRQKAFDDFTWPMATTICFAVLVVMAAGFALWLQHEANKVKEAGLKWARDGHNARVNQGLSPSTGQIDFWENRLAGMTGGALGRFWENPALQSALLPVFGAVFAWLTGGFRP